MSKEKVGTELAALIPSWAVQFEGRCSCKDVALKMDKWGAEGCEKRRDYIVKHLASQNEKLIPALRSIPRSIKQIVAGKLLNKAIKNAKRKAEQ